jgi:2-aminoadipate transaminase
MAAALKRAMPAGCTWQVPRGGMFFWIRLPAGLDAVALLPRAVDRGVAFVPGAAFYARDAQANTMRLSFVTLTEAQIDTAVDKLAAVLHEAIDAQRVPEAVAR